MESSNICFCIYFNTLTKLLACIQVNASDKDGFYNKLTYSIVSGNDDNKFTMNASTGLISTNATLDRETVAQFILNVRSEDSKQECHYYPLLSTNIHYYPRNHSLKIRKPFDHFYLDGISPARTAETIVIVNVVDFSDHSPVFLQDHYNVSVFENLAVGTTVLTVEATDNDKVKHKQAACCHNRDTDSVVTQCCRDQI